MTLALIFPTYYVTSNVLGQWGPAAIAPRLLLNATVLCLVFGGLPALAVWYCRDLPRTTYRWAWPGGLSLLGAVLMGLGLWTWAHELFVVADQVFGIRGLDASKVAGVRATLEKLRETSPALVVATLALTPAVVEELCFRGYLFSAVGRRFTPLATILITALLFGLFHVLTGSTLLLERFLPTTMLGLVLGTVAWRSGSVLPGIALHFTHNAFLELVACYGNELETWGIGLQEQTHLPWSWLLVGTLLAVVGAGLVFVRSAASGDEWRAEVQVEPSGP
jgi:ABC-2 type transport system permease protein/sodium transport system permease protein